MNNKILMDLAKQFGMPAGVAESKAAEYSGKSDEEIMMEIAKLKQSMKGNPQMYQQQMQAMKTLAAGMNGQQKARLNKIIELLES